MIAHSRSLCLDIVLLSVFSSPDCWFMMNASLKVRRDDRPVSSFYLSSLRRPLNPSFGLFAYWMFNVGQTMLKFRTGPALRLI
jgi:hypothetical protein